MGYTERVSIRRGPAPILIVAPHAAPGDDINTGIIADHLVELIKGNAVINRGWQRGDTYDYYKDQADCNNITHMVDVVKDEFLRPITTLKTEILRRSPTCHLFFIHGMAAQKGVDVVIGYGAGSPNSYSCNLWRKNLFYHLLDKNLDVFVGKSGGNYSGWARNNMNQYFRKHVYEPEVQSMQLELSREIRSDRGVAELTAEYLAVAMLDYINHDKFDRVMLPPEI